MMKLLVSMFALLLVSACSVLPPQPLAHSVGFEPVLPLEKQAERVPTGGIYVSRGQMGNIFSNPINLGSSVTKSVGTGKADQEASLTGSVAVSVVSVMANGNLVLRGEKQVALTEGAEIIQVSGIIRPEDVSAVNTVQSRRLANAQISYRGSGDLASTAKAGWGTSALMKLWPF